MKPLVRSFVRSFLRSFGRVSLYPTRGGLLRQLCPLVSLGLCNLLRVVRPFSPLLVQLDPAALFPSDVTLANNKHPFLLYDSPNARIFGPNSALFTHGYPIPSPQLLARQRPSSFLTAINAIAVNPLAV